MIVFDTETARALNVVLGFVRIFVVEETESFFRGIREFLTSEGQLPGRIANRWVDSSLRFHALLRPATELITSLLRLPDHSTIVLREASRVSRIG